MIHPVLSDAKIAKYLGEEWGEYPIREHPNTINSSARCMATVTERG